MATKFAFDISNPSKKWRGNALLVLERMIDGETISYRDRFEVMVCFAMSGDKPMTRAAFEKVWGAMTADEILDAWGKLMNLFAEKAVPQSSGTPSEVGEASPDGSSPLTSPSNGTDPHTETPPTPGPVTSGVSAG